MSDVIKFRSNGVNLSAQIGRVVVLENDDATGRSSGLIDLAGAAQRDRGRQCIRRLVGVGVVDLPARLGEARRTAVAIVPETVWLAGAAEEPVGQLADGQALAGDLLHQRVGIGGFAGLAIGGVQARERRRRLDLGQSDAERVGNEDAVIPAPVFPGEPATGTFCRPFRQADA